jgi:hypothetical protein
MNSIGKEFREKTKLQYLDGSDQSNNLPQPPLEAKYDASRPVIYLPAPENIKIRSFDLKHAVEGRRSMKWRYGEREYNYLELGWSEKFIIYVEC